MKKRSLSSIILSVALILQIPLQSQGGLAALTGNVGLGLGGVQALALSLPFGVIVGVSSQSTRRGIFATLFAAGIGLVLLDEKSGEAELQPISKDLALQAGLSQQEWLAYHQERLELEIIREEIFQNILVMTQGAEINSEQEQIAQKMSLESWNEAQQRVSSESISALKKLTEFQRNKAQQLSK